MIVCVKCGLRMHSMENGVTVERFDAGESFQLWQADLWECRNLGVPELRDESHQGFCGEALGATRASGLRRASCLRRRDLPSPRGGSAVSAAVPPLVLKSSRSEIGKVAWERRRRTEQMRQEYLAEQPEPRRVAGGLAGKEKGAATKAEREAQNRAPMRECPVCRRKYRAVHRSLYRPGAWVDVICPRCSKEWLQVLRAGGVQGIPLRAPGGENGTLS